MRVKGDQPALLEDLAHLFAEADLPGSTDTARTVDKGHGRLEVRRLHASDALVGYTDWPSLAQALGLSRGDGAGHRRGPAGAGLCRDQPAS